jgi:hypothetical protein
VQVYPPVHSLPSSFLPLPLFRNILNRQHPLIFNENSPSLENLRKITAESKYKDYSAPTSTLTTPHYQSNSHSSNPSSYKSSPTLPRATVAIKEPLPPTQTIPTRGTPANYNVINSYAQPYNSDFQESYIQYGYPQYHPNPIFPPQAISYNPPVPQPTMYYQYQPSNGPTPTQPATQSYPPPNITSPSSPNTTATSSPTKEQLYFSKQPREVYFKPHNLNDYRKLKDEISSLKMGNLGPDLQVLILTSLSLHFAIDFDN